MVLARVEYVLFAHFRLALHAAILFAVGLFAAAPVVHYRLKAVEWLPWRIFRLVLLMMGRRPGLLRMSAVIWLFNSTVMFAYMASGFHPMLPKVFGIWVGLNIGVVAARSAREDELAPWAAAEADSRGWVPPVTLVVACGALVVLLEMPCFCYALAMGMSMGSEVQAGGDYLSSLRPRAMAYLTVIVPALLASALAESIALRAPTPGRGPHARASK